MNPGTVQPTLRGSEHRSAVLFLPFSAAGILGSEGGEWCHTQLTWALCELAALVRDRFNAPCATSGHAYALKTELCDRMSAWLHGDFIKLFGQHRKPKIHKLMAHLLEEFMLRGNVQDGNTGLNEALHKALKKAWLRTNTRREEYSLQMLMAEQMAGLLSYTRSAVVVDHEDLLQDPASAPAGDAVGLHGQEAADEGADVVVVPAAACAPSAPSAALPVPTMNAVCGRERNLTVSALAEEQGLDGLADVLQVDEYSDVTLSGAVSLTSGARRRDAKKQILRASPNFYGAPHFSWFEYQDEDGTTRRGRARAVLSRVGDAIGRVVVFERLTTADPEPDCPFFAYGCRRLRWVTRQGQGGPVHGVVRLDAISRLLCVEHDWADWVVRHGLKVMPVEVPRSAKEVHERRFFINAFARD